MLRAGFPIHAKIEKTLGKDFLESEVLWNMSVSILNVIFLGNNFAMKFEGKYCLLT